MGSLIWAVFVSRHLQAQIGVMVITSKAALALCLLVGSTMGARQLRNNVNRKGKNLLGTFPFNAQEGDHKGEHHGANHGAEHGGSHPASSSRSSLGSRSFRQGASGLCLEPVLAVMGRGVLTRWRWWRRRSMMMWCSVTTPMTGGVTPLM